MAAPRSGRRSLRAATGARSPRSRARRRAAASSTITRRAMVRRAQPSRPLDREAAARWNRALAPGTHRRPACEDCTGSRRDSAADPDAAPASEALAPRRPAHSSAGLARTWAASARSLHRHPRRSGWRPAARSKRSGPRTYGLQEVPLPRQREATQAGLLVEHPRQHGLGRGAPVEGRVIGTALELGDPPDGSGHHHHRGGEQEAGPDGSDGGWASGLWVAHLTYRPIRRGT